jgi:hypothetical protein
MPIGRSRRHVQANEIVVLVASAASDRVRALPVWSTVNLHRVSMAVVALTRKISVGVAIHAAGVVEDRHNCFERSSGPALSRDTRS